VKTLVQYAGLEQTSESAEPLHLAIGMFDGLHLGHHAVIDTALQSAHESGGKAAVLTFWPHPSALFRSQDPTPLIMAPETKAHILGSWGIDALITQEFTPEFAAITAEDFLPTLKRHLPNLTAIYVGENWRFGRGR
jgi:riboflavin kinase / FMN adenylyltransferase